MAKKAEKISREARQAVEKWSTYFKTNHDQYHEMHAFVLGRQWNDDEENMLKTFKKVPLQFNKLATLVNTLLGEQQQNTPQLEIVPLSNCDEETAQIREIVVKDIMLSADAKMAYQVAAAQSFVGGYGAYIIDTDYTHEKSFEVDIVYRYVKDATKCFWDIGAENVSKIDGMHCGYLSRMTRAKFKQTYGKDIEEKILKDGSVTQSKEEIALAVEPKEGDTPFSWADQEGVTIIDYYVRKYVNDTLYKLSNGDTLNQSEMEDLVLSSVEYHKKMQAQQAEMQMMQMMQQQQQMQGQEMQGQEMQGQEMQMLANDNQLMPAANDPPQNDDAEMMLYSGGEPVRIDESRSSKRSKIMRYKIAGDYILEESEFPSEDLPVIFMDQTSYIDKNGKQVCRPFIIDAVDAQRYLNYLGTQSAFILKVSRYDQFIGSKKNVQSLDTQRTWKDPSAVQGMLAYDESPSGAKPEQLRPPELSVSLTQQYERAINDMYTSTGLYPSRLGQQGNEVSGVAIDARTRQGSYTTYVAFNSVNRAITAGGKIVNQLIPRVYDTERVLTLMTPDEGRKSITVNQQQDEYGEVIKNDIRKGSFEVRLQAGPSYEGQKEQALQSLNMVLQANPSLLNLFADLYAENLPLVNTIEIKNRLKTIVPPEILQAGKTGKMPEKAQQPNPQDQAAMAEIEFKKQQIEIKKAELEIKMKEQEAMLEKAQMQLEMKRLELMTELEETKLRYLAETDRTRSDNAISHADNITKLLMADQKEKLKE